MSHEWFVSDLKFQVQKCSGLMERNCLFNGSKYLKIMGPGLLSFYREAMTFVVIRTKQLLLQVWTLFWTTSQNLKQRILITSRSCLSAAFLWGNSSVAPHLMTTVLGKYHNAIPHSRSFSEITSLDYRNAWEHNNCLLMAYITHQKDINGFEMRWSSL